MIEGSIRTVDSKGRVNIGADLAGSQVIAQAEERGIILKFVKAVPAHEAWLWENETALKAVRTGIEQAASGEITDGPANLESSLNFAQSLDDAE